jgi:predicted CXXCH cytochrome family protein
LSRTTLISVLALIAVAAGLPTSALDPHLDSSLLPGSCKACHLGHGASRSPMLPGPQSELCLSCHDSQAKVDRAVARGALAPGARPPLLGTTLAQPFRHPLTEGAFSHREDGAVTCTSCHSPHRGSPGHGVASAQPGERKVSTRNPARMEYELCESCHGGSGLAPESALDVSRLLNPDNRSYHPVEGPSVNGSVSVRRDLSGQQINCTDCHGNSDPAGAQGPHGSAYRFILRANYVTVDGSAESLKAYALCYSCHDRSRVLDSVAFPLHRKHIVEERASCSSCHNPHGSVENQALIHFGEGDVIAGVAPSARTGRLGFVSTGPGSGECYLTCHGRDHAPEAYGGVLPGTPSGEPRRILPRR